jgi:hypothetical protein
MVAVFCKFSIDAQAGRLVAALQTIRKAFAAIHSHDLGAISPLAFMSSPWGHGVNYLSERVMGRDLPNCV